MSYSKIQSGARVGALLVVFMAPWTLAYADKSINERQPADLRGLVEISNLSGSVEFSAWDRPEVEVTGTTTDGVERVDLATTGNRTSINVVMHGRIVRGGDARLLIHVPVMSSVSATLVSADFKVNGIKGDVKVQTVNGDVSGNVGGNLRASTVSGNVRITARDARTIEIKTISGDVQLSGGGGEVEITTVSGTAKLELAALTRGRFKSVSGDFSAQLALAPDARLDGESVSGNIALDFPTAPGAEFDIQTFSGDIDNCFGPAPVKPRYGPGSRLAFKSGDGQAEVHIDTKSGDVRLCGKGLKDKKTAGVPAA